MGRLIDADKLWKATTTSIDYCGDFLEIIEKQETAKAITVDWIESYAVLAEADGRPFFADGIRDMVEEWRKDQKGN